MTNKINKTNLLSLMEIAYLNELAPEGKPTDLFGKYFAGEERGVPNHWNSEENTSEEDNVLGAMYSYFQDNNKTRLDKKMPSIAKLAKQGKYAKFLKAPKGKVCYRMLFGVPVTVAAKLLRLPQQEIVSDTSQAWYVSGGGVLVPNKSQIQGWSLEDHEILIANITGLNRINPKTCTIIFASNTNQGNFFFNPDNLSKAGDIGGVVPDEEEVVSYGPTKFIEAAYYYHGEQEPGTRFSYSAYDAAKACFVALDSKSSKQHASEIPTLQTPLSKEELKNKINNYNIFYKQLSAIIIDELIKNGATITKNETQTVYSKSQIENLIIGKTHSYHNDYIYFRTSVEQMRSDELRIENRIKDGETSINASLLFISGVYGTVNSQPLTIDSSKKINEKQIREFIKYALTRLNKYHKQKK